MKVCRHSFGAVTFFFDFVHWFPLTVELGVVIGKTGRNISQAQADKYIAGYGLWCIELSLEDGSQTGTTLQPWQLT